MICVKKYIDRVDLAKTGREFHSLGKKELEGIWYNRKVDENRMGSLAECLLCFREWRNREERRLA